MVREIFHRLRASFRRRKPEREMDAEMRFHLEMETAENIRRGMNEEEARRAALRSFGGVDLVKEAYRDLSRFRLFEELWQDPPQRAIITEAARFSRLWLCSR